MIPLKTFVITLPESPERTAKTKQHFDELGVSNYSSFGEIAYFDGIYAVGFGLDTKHPYNRDRKPSDGDYFMGPQPTGIFLSHYMLWAACNQLPNSHFFIMENDAKYTPGWQTRFENAMRDVPSDFDYLFIGCCCAAGKPTTHIHGETYEVKYPMCTQAYIVAKKAIPTLLATQRDCYGPIDITLTLHSLPLLKTYTVLPRIVDQFDTYIPP